MRRFITCILSIVVAIATVYEVTGGQIILAANQDELSTIVKIEKTLNIPCEHTFGDYELTVAPSVNTNGIETRICTRCRKKEKRVYICPHTNVRLVESEPATCLTTGFENFACEDCGTVVDTIVLEQIPCNFGDWYCVVQATPIEPGRMTRECVSCGSVETKEYTMEMAGPNSIFVPGTEINHEFAVTSFTQHAVDTNEIVYTEDAWGHDPNNPFILGHNYGAMQYIADIQIGQYIYVSVNNEIEIYEVVVSEFAMQNSTKKNIVGQTTGMSMWDSVGDKTLHMYTCYGGTNGRWLVLAKLIAV
jgi:hypothetical protein